MTLARLLLLMATWKDIFQNAMFSCLQNGSGKVIQTKKGRLGSGLLKLLISTLLIESR